MQLTKNEMELNNREIKIIHCLPSEESHPVTDPLEETEEKFCEETRESLPNLNIIIINIICNIL